MATAKTGFIFYFDNYPMLSPLPMEQRGLLFSALMIYADRVWREPSTTLEEVMEGFPQLSQEAKMACGFIGAAIHRDTQAWLNRREYRSKKKQEPISAEAEARRTREDMERARRLLEQMRQE